METYLRGYSLPRDSVRREAAMLALHMLCVLGIVRWWVLLQARVHSRLCRPPIYLDQSAPET